MSLPSYTRFIEPLLRYLGDQTEAVHTKVIYEAVAAVVGLSEEQKSEMLPSGQQTVYQNRIGWAHDRLKRAGYSSSPRRGYWILTDAGSAFIKAHPKPLTEVELETIWKTDTKKKLSLMEHDDAVASSTPPDTEGSPQERIEHGIEELNESVGEELLELILQASPTFFEGLVLELLHAIGYGTSRSDLQRVGGSGDGGIDGIISLDKLGLEKVYVQAKRWQNNVGRPELQSFFGALAGRKANKGVFITTSHFTKEAREFAQAVSDSIVLVNGARLTELMIEHGVGVSHRTLRIAKVDSDYFEDA